MRSDIKTMTLVLSLASAAACSVTPHATAPAAGTVAQPPQSPQTLVAANNPASPASSTSATAPPPPGDVDPKLVKAGYSVMRRHGEVYYCRNEIITGQRIGSRICLTAGQIQDEQQNVTKAKDMMNQPSYQWLGASCSN